MLKNKNIIKNIVDISTMVTQSTNFFEIKDKIVEKMLEVIQPSKACINLFYNNDYEYAYLVCSATLEQIPNLLPESSPIGIKLDFNQAYPEYIHEAVREKKIIYVEDIFDNKKAVDERELAQIEGYKGRIVFPLLINDIVIGFMTCFLTEEDYLDDTDITFLSSVVSLISLSIEVTLENKHIKDLINKFRESITKVNDITTKFYLNKDVYEFMNDLSDQAKNLTKSQEAFIIIDNLNYDYKIFTTLKTKKKIDFQKILEDISKDDRDGRYENDIKLFLSETLEIKNYSYYKLKEDDKLVGCILCLNSNGYTEDDFNILELLSKQAILGMQLYKYNKDEIKHRLIANELNILNKQQKLIMDESAMDLNNSKDLYFYHKPATVVGGDFYHAEPITDDKVVYIIADVMGHGIVSNYMVALIKGSLKALCHQYKTPSDIMSKLNEILYDEFDKMGVFATCIIGVIDTQNNILEISNAGHYCPIIIDNSGNLLHTTMDICRKNIPLGVLEDVTYEHASISLDDKTMICMYTDGIIELKNKEKEEFGLDRFTDFLVKNYNLNKDKLIKELKKELECFSKKNNFDDDILFVCLSHK